ncbi:MAG: hypothetical protein BGO98_28925 [Myxococcales bacterium 68-20]|nr:MAG: hypothetical protein BGO98_28925 [Myxococcales bacterium 68-20]
MTSRTRVPRWTPPLGEALRLAWRPALAYLAFTALGSLALILTSAFYSRGSGKDVVIFALGTAAGLVGVLLGQLIAVLRMRALPVFIAAGICVALAVWVMSFTNPPGGEYIQVPFVFFCFAFPCGLLSLMHRWELFASFWPAASWIGGVFLILNEENRVGAWEENKVSAWLPVPLLYLGCFLVLLLLYLAAKQAARIEMWQALSGAAARRISKAETTKQRVSALPRKNLVPLLVVAALLFGGTAILAPYLWRTGKGNRESHSEPREHDDRPPREGPDFDGEGIVRQMQKLANAAKETLPKLWPLLFLVVLYRPTKRALLLTHLKTPIVPAPPSERIDNLWEYVRIAAEDAGVVPTSADSVEQLMVRIRVTKRASPALESAAEIYMRTRYGFTVQPGDALAMRGHASEAATALRKDLGVWVTVKNLWRPLS